MKKEKVIVFIYGSGGHKTQMARLLNLMEEKLEKERIKKIGIAEIGYSLENIFEKKYELKPIRDKYSYKKTFRSLIPTIVKTVRIVNTIKKNYEIKGIITTGPGIALIPTLLFKIYRKKIVFIETWSKFYKGTITGRIIYKFADKFYIQNESLKKQYPKGIYGGKL